MKEFLILHDNFFITNSEKVFQRVVSLIQEFNGEAGKEIVGYKQHHYQECGLYVVQTRVQNMVNFMQEKYLWMLNIKFIHFVHILQQEFELEEIEGEEEYGDDAAEDLWKKLEKDLTSIARDCNSDLGWEFLCGDGILVYYRYSNKEKYLCVSYLE